MSESREDGIPVGGEGDAVRAKSRMHESGRPMVVLAPFRPRDVTRTAVGALLAAARDAVAPDAPVVRACLDPDQTAERALLETMGFAVDGFEYGFAPERLAAAVQQRGARLPEGVGIRKMEFERDIDAVAALETAVHAADPTSRVDFSTAEAVAGMRGYYQRAAGAGGVRLLLRGDRIIGLAGFMPDRQRPHAVHISSVSIDLEHQGSGLFFPFILACLKEPELREIRLVTGVTTTRRLIDVAARYGFELLGLSLSRVDAPQSTPV